MTESVTKLAFFGDWAPGNKDVVLSAPDCPSILNLEGPVIDAHGPIPEKPLKAGPSLANSSLPDFPHGGVLSAANNHFMDFGVGGAESSQLRVLESNWKLAGYGMNAEEARTAIVFKLEGLTIGFLSRCEHQFGIAQLTQPGVAGIDATLFAHIRKLRHTCDIIIVSLHAGSEMLPWPSPSRQQTYRALIDSGADVVHGHHSHVPQGYEYYNGAVIFYGLGNYCVDPVKWCGHPNALWSLSPQISFDTNGIECQVQATEIQQYKHDIKLTTFDPSKLGERRLYLEQCNEPLSEPELLEGIWQEFCLSEYKRVYSRWLGFSGILPRKATRGLYQFLKTFLKPCDGPLTHARMAVSREDLLRHHLFSCESHSNALATALGLLGGEIVDLRTPESRELHRAIYRPS